MALLEGSLAVKIGVVASCIISLVATSQKTTHLALLGSNKIENPIFMWQVKKP
jgi:hypothetical protein